MVADVLFFSDTHHPWICVGDHPVISGTARMERMCVLLHTDASVSPPFPLPPVGEHEVSGILLRWGAKWWAGGHHSFRVDTLHGLAPGAGGNRTILLVPRRVILYLYYVGKCTGDLEACLPPARTRTRARSSPHWDARPAEISMEGLGAAQR